MEETNIKSSEKTKYLIIIIFSIILNIILVTLILSNFTTCNSSDVINATNDTTVIDYHRLYSLTLSSDLAIEFHSINYNLENFSLEYYTQKVENDFKGQSLISTIQLNTDSLEIIQKNFRNVFDDENISITSYYLIKQNDILVTFYIYYSTEEIYNENSEIITRLMKEFEIPFDKEKTYDNIFTNMILYFDIMPSTNLEYYRNIASQKSLPVKKYEKLTDNAKIAYDKLYNTLFVKNENLSITAEEYNEFEYDLALFALNSDLIYFNYEFYEIDFSSEFNETLEDDIFTFSCKETSTLHLPKLTLQDCYPNIIEIEMTNQEKEIFNETVAKILNNMPDNLTTLGKYKYLANSLCELCEYAHEELEYEEKNNLNNETSRIHDIHGALVDYRCVCDGYAWAYLYLCQKEYLFCNYIEGWIPNSNDNTEMEGHAFNYIKIDNSYYFVDITWMDSSEYIPNDFYFAFSYDSLEPETPHKDYIDYNGIDSTESSNYNELIKNCGNIKWNSVLNGSI